MRITVVFAALLAVGPNVVAQPDTEFEQDRLYVNCFIKNRFPPENQTALQVATCAAEAGIPDPGEDARKTAGNSWRACLLAEAAAVDDNMSSPQAIAPVVVSSCSTEWTKYVSSMWLPPSARRKMQSDVKRFANDEGVRAVLFSRRSKTSGNSPR